MSLYSSLGFGITIITATAKVLKFVQPPFGQLAATQVFYYLCYLSHSHTHTHTLSLTHTYYIIFHILVFLCLLISNLSFSHILLGKEGRKIKIYSFSINYEL